MLPNNGPVATKRCRAPAGYTQGRVARPAICKWDTPGSDVPERQEISPGAPTLSQARYARAPPRTGCRFVLQAAAIARRLSARWRNRLFPGGRAPAAQDREQIPCDSLTADKKPARVADSSTLYRHRSAGHTGWREKAVPWLHSCALCSLLLSPGPA